MLVYLNKSVTKGIGNVLYVSKLSKDANNRYLSFIWVIYDINTRRLKKNAYRSYEFNLCILCNYVVYGRKNI